jgi:hypothetical protein
MRRIVTAIMCLVLLAGASLPAFAQVSHGRYAGRAEQYRRYDNSRRVYYDRRYNDDRSFLEKHRDKVTVAGGAAAGALIGALAGGKKGAIIGALIGGGGSALYTYGIRDHRDDRSFRRR